MNARNTIAILAFGVLVLAGIGAYLIHSRPAQPGTIADSQKDERSIRQSQEGKPGSSPAGSPVAVPAAAWDWAGVESEDYRKYVANLRAIECPEYTIRDIIVADLNKLFAPREAPFKDPPAEVTPPTSTKATAKAADVAARRAAYERRKQLREIEKEKAAVVKELLGYTLPLSPLRGWYSRNYDRFEAALNSLPPEKRERVREVQESFWEAHDRLSDAFPNQNPYPKEFAEQYRKANEDRRAAMATVLGPDELEDYEMRASGTAARLASQLAGISLTPDQFKAIYRSHAETEEPYGGTIPLQQLAGSEPSELARKREESEKLLRETLGEHGWDQYQRAQDNGWQTLKQLKSRFDLADEVVEKAYELQRRVATEAAVDPQRMQALKELQNQLTKARRAGETSDPEQLRSLRESIELENQEVAKLQQQAAEKRQAGMKEIAALLGEKPGLIFAARNGVSPTADFATTTTLPDGTVVRRSGRSTTIESAPVVLPRP